MEHTTFAFQYSRVPQVCLLKLEVKGLYTVTTPENHPLSTVRYRLFNTELREL
jgi:hypothetical protein